MIGSMVLRTPPPGFVDLSAHVPGIRLCIGYGRASNFTGAPLPGYGAQGAWLLRPCGNALLPVQESLQKKGLGLLVYDAYRPIRATRAMVVWAESTGNAHLLTEGYISRKSWHNRGNAIDLTIVDLAGEPLDMGTPWDAFHEGSHVANASAVAAENRALLHGVMGAHGWQPYSKEWWHFTFPMDDVPRIDVPYGVDEPDLM